MFKERLRESFQDGLLLAVKYSTLILIVLFVLNYLYNIKQQAMNGNSAAEAIVEYQKAGVLPKFPLTKDK